MYNSLEIVNQDGYEWHKVEDNLWCAMGEWAEWLPKKEQPVEPTPEPIPEPTPKPEPEKPEHKGFFRQLFDLIVDLIHKIFG